MIQDIYPLKLNNQYQPEAVPAPQDQALCYKNGTLLVNMDGELTFPLISDFAEDTEWIYLFSVGDERYFLKAGEEAQSFGAFTYENVWQLRAKLSGPKYRIFAALTAKHLGDWYRDNAYCGRCGNKMTHDVKERAMACTCGYKSYPRIMPAVIVGVKNGEKLLLTKYRGGFRHNALIAGFVEIGETLEETVQREVMEEAGIKVKNIRYYKSQPWGLANDILTGFYCEVDGETEIHMDESELSYAEWVQREEIELQPDDFSLTNEMMMMFKNGVEQ